MLKYLRRRKIAKRILIILAAIIIPPFVFWGSGSIIREKQEKKSLGKIYGKNLSLLEYQDALQAVKNIAILHFGNKFNEVIKYLDLETQALQRIVLLREAKKRKIQATDAEVIKFIKELPLFERNGRFDDKIYNSELMYGLRTPARVFEEQIRQNIILQKLYRQVTDSININPEEVRSEYQKANEQISVFYVASLPADFEKEVIPSEAELKEYFAKNSVNFKEPPSYNLEYLTSDSEEKIKKAVQRLRKETDFNAIARELGIITKETGLFKQTEAIPGIGWSQTITNAILKMQPGEVSPVIKTEKSFYILRLKEKKDSYIPDFDKLKDKVRNSLIKESSREKARKAIENSWTVLKTSSDLNLAAKQLGLKYGSTELFKYGSYIEGVGSSDLFWEKANKLKDNELSEIIELPSGFYIIKVKNKVPYDEKKFAAEKDEFAAALLTQKKEEHFASFIKELMRKARQ